MDLYPNMLLPERKEESPFWYLCLGPSYSIERRIEKHKTTFCRKEMMSLTSWNARGTRRRAVRESLENAGRKTGKRGGIRLLDETKRSLIIKKV